MENGHYFARKIIDAHHFADRIFRAKKLFANRAPYGANVGSAVHIILGENRALIDVPTLYIEVLGGYSAVRGMPVLIAVHNLYRIVDVGRNTFDQRHLILERD